jgi:hypothetical protein
MQSGAALLKPEEYESCQDEKERAHNSGEQHGIKTARRKPRPDLSRNWKVVET